MRITQKTKRVLLLLLVLFLIHPIMSGPFENAQCFDWGASKSPVTFFTGSIHTDIAFFNTFSRRTSSRSISADFDDSLPVQVYFADVSENEPINHAALPDLRKEIVRTIPQYYHGSKYKEGNLCI